jgi:hypothetical protein
LPDKSEWFSWYYPIRDLIKAKVPDLDDTDTVTWVLLLMQLTRDATGSEGHVHLPADVVADEIELDLAGKDASILRFIASQRGHDQRRRLRNPDKIFARFCDLLVKMGEADLIDLEILSFDPLKVKVKVRAEVLDVLK